VPTNSSTIRHHAENRLLGALDPVLARRVASHLERVHLEEGQVIVEAGVAQRAVYFPVGCLASVLVERSDGRGVEVGLAGREGFIGLPLVLDTDPAPHRVVCQVAGEALTMPADRFRALLECMPAFRALLCRYIGIKLVEAAQLLACNSLHHTLPRLARWLLMAGDRVGADQFRLTQEFLGRMLAVRRPYLNAAAQQLRSTGCISYQRGQVSLLNRAQLELVACEDYRILGDQYARLLDPLCASSPTPESP
jgi:CRP-like cAMP-binding protein